MVDNTKVWYNSQYEDAVYGTPQSFSFTDVQATVILPFILPSAGKPPMVGLPGLTLLSVSEHRDTYPVVSLGGRGIKGYTTGHRTSAGTLAFLAFGESAFAGVIRKYAEWRGTPGDTTLTSPDELPPFDISILLHNDKGDASTILMRSVKIVDSSRNISVRDIQLNEVYSYMAANVTHLINANRQIEYTPFNAPVPQQDYNPFLEQKPAPNPGA